MNNLYTKLIKYNNSDFYPMHMPGHKRRSDLINMINPLQIDITEIEEFDDLHHAKGILKSCQEKAQELYGSGQTHFLINGSTVGLLSAISACTRKGGKVLIARNCHKSVYNAIYLNELTPIYIYPFHIPKCEVNGSINPHDVESALSLNKDIQLVVITSPTYEGIVSDVSSIAEITRKHSIPLLVDEAHGGHFGFESSFPQNSLSHKADIVVHSLHKTLPALTQTALLHVNTFVGDNIKNEIKKYLSIYQTSSPSYVLMSSIDLCIDIMAKDSRNIFKSLASRLNIFNEKINNLPLIKSLHYFAKDCPYIYDFDISRLVFFADEKRLTGTELYNLLLNQYHIQMEAMSNNYVLGISTIFDSDEGFERLLAALTNINKIIEKKLPPKNSNVYFEGSNFIAKIAMTPSRACEKNNTEINFSDSEGKISAEYVYLYPPGIPLLVPGEIISKELIEHILSSINNGLNVKGLKGENLKKISIILC